MTDVSSMPFVLMHDYTPISGVGPRACGAVAYYMRWMPNRGEPFRSRDIVETDGRAVEGHSEIRCGSCGERILQGNMMRIFIRPNPLCLDETKAEL